MSKKVILHDLERHLAARLQHAADDFLDMCDVAEISDKDANTTLLTTLLAMGCFLVHQGSDGEVSAQSFGAMCARMYAHWRVDYRRKKKQRKES